MTGNGEVSEAVLGRSVRARAPVRIADVGGWTDTWFGSPGRVCHVAVGPGIEVVARIVARPSTGALRGDEGPYADGSPRVHLVAPSIGADLWVGPSPDPGGERPRPGEHPLLEHAIAAVLEDVQLADEVAVELVISSEVPPGASLGTSASVVVALLGALDALVAGGRRSAAELAVLAHQVETRRAGREAGVQDQWAAAMGGVGLLVIGPYPDVRRQEVAVADRTLAEVGERTVTVVFGAHDSSEVHAEVIDALVACSDVVHDRARRALRRLSELAGDAADALADGDVDRWAAVLSAATEVQAELHPGLVGAPHRRAIDAARSLAAAGWKVNGAGGAGGSLTVVAGSAAAHASAGSTAGAASAGAASAEELADALAALDPTWQILRLTPAPGLWVTPVT